MKFSLTTWCFGLEIRKTRFFSLNVQKKSPCFKILKLIWSATTTKVNHTSIFNIRYLSIEDNSRSITFLDFHKDYDDHSRSILIEEFFSAANTQNSTLPLNPEILSFPNHPVPPMEGPLYLKNDSKKGWKKYHFILKSCGQYFLAITHSNALKFQLYFYIIKTYASAFMHLFLMQFVMLFVLLYSSNCYIFTDLSNVLFFANFMAKILLWKTLFIICLNVYSINIFNRTLLLSKRQSKIERYGVVVVFRS